MFKLEAKLENDIEFHFNSIFCNKNEKDLIIINLIHIVFKEYKFLFYLDIFPINNYEIYLNNIEKEKFDFIEWIKKGECILLPLGGS